MTGSIGPVVDWTAAQVWHARSPRDSSTRRPRCRHEGRQIATAEAPAAFLVLHRHAAEEHSLIFPGGHVHQLRARTIRRRIPVGTSLHRRVRRHARRLRCLNRLAVGVEGAHPIHFHERLAEHELAGFPVQHIKVAVTIGPQHRLQRRTLERDVDEHRDLH